MTIETAIAELQSRGYTIHKSFKKIGKRIEPRYWAKNSNGQPMTVSPNGMTSATMIVNAEFVIANWKA